MIRKERLANGITVLTESMPHVRSVSLGVWLRQGSRHETASRNGISHFLEHLVFKGTENRTSREIALAMESVGGQMDAFTSKETTCFYTKILDQHLPEAVDLLSDIVMRPLFDPVELERERKVVLEEIRMVEDSPDELIYDLFSESFYRSHALGRPIQGTEETVGSFSRSSLLRFFRRAYSPENILIVAAGNLKHRQLVRMIEDAFSAMEPSGNGHKRLTRPRVHAGVTTRSKKLEQLHVMVGLPSFEEKASYRYPLYVLNALLGGTMSSRLFQKIREERGLAYTVYSGVNAFMDSGFMMVYAATSPDKGREVVRLIMDELAKLRDAGPDPDEVEASREHMKGSLMLSLESTSSRMSNLARQEIYFGRQFTLAEILRGIDRVTPEAVHEVAARMFDSPRVGLAAVGRLNRFRIRPEEVTL